MLRQAIPITVSRLGMMGLALVDTIMVGQYASADLAYLAVGQVPPNIFILALIGLLLGTSVLASHHFGARDYARAGEVWWRSLPYALFWGVVGLLICAQGEWLLLAAGQTPEIAAAGGHYSLIIGLSIPLAALHVTSAFFLEGIRRPRPAMLVMIGANIVNALANYVFVYGHFGAPEMGAEGAAWASFATRIMQAAAIIAYILLMRDHAQYAVRRPPKPSWRAGRRLRNIGYAAGLSMGLESAAFQALTIFAGWLSAMTAAAYIITINVFATFFMLGLGVSTASGVLVGNAFGAGDRAEISRAARFGWLVLLVIMASLSLFMYATATPFARIFSSDPQVVALAAALLAYSALGLVFDSSQSLLAQACRAQEDAWVPTLFHIVSYGGVMIPATYLAVFYFERGAYGLIDGIIIGSITAMLLMGGRFLYLERRAHFGAAH